MDEPEDDLTLVYMWASKQAEKKYKGRIEELEAALSSAESWIDRWTKHVGNCSGGHLCTCGRTLILYEARAALGEKKDV